MENAESSAAKREPPVAPSGVGLVELAQHHLERAVRTKDQAEMRYHLRSALQALFIETDDLNADQLND